MESFKFRTILLLSFLLSAGFNLLALEFQSQEGIYFRYDDTEEKTVTVIASPNAYSGSITIPGHVMYGGEQYEVIAIGSDAFADCEGLTDVMLPNTIQTIGARAFKGCSQLSSISIPASVQEIDYYAFHTCPALKSIYISDSDEPLKFCDGFQDTHISSLYMGRNITFPSLSPFDTQTELAELTIGNHVTYIEEGLFSGCTALETIVIPNSVTEIRQNAFYLCSGITSLTLGNAVETIGSDAFRGISISRLSIPASVTYLAGFMSTESLRELRFEDSETPITIMSGYYSGVTNQFSKSPIEKLYMGRDFNIDYKTPIGMNSTCTSVEIGAKVTAINDDLFSGFSVLETIVIPNTVKSIGKNAFSGCSLLRNVTLPDGLETIGENTFSGCRDLESIDFPEALTFIGTAAFKGCSALVCADFPEKLETIGASAFYSCAALNTIHFKSNLATVENLAFRSCPNLKKVTFATRNFKVLDGMFYSVMLDELVLPMNIETINLYNCTARDFYVPASEPPVLEAYASYKVTTLHVPYGSREKYAAAENWSQFSTIVEDMPVEETVNESNGDVLFSIEAEPFAVGYLVALYTDADCTEIVDSRYIAVESPSELISRAATVGTASCTFSGLTPNSTYYYLIYGIDADGVKVSLREGSFSATSGVSSPGYAGKVSICYGNGSLRINACEAGVPFSIYSLGGQSICSGTTEGLLTVVDLAGLGTGVYVVSVGSDSFRFLKY